MRDDIRKFAVIILLAAALLSPFVIWDVLTSGEVLNAIILIGLVCVTIIYARETWRIAEAAREQAEEMKMARFASLRPILSIVPETQLPGLPEKQWLARPSRVRSNDVRIMNFGPGPALNGVLSLCAGSKSIADWKLPSLGSGWGHIANISPCQDRNSVTVLRLSYNDVFGYEHVTSYNVKFTDAFTFEVEDELHKCDYRRDSC